MSSPAPKRLRPPQRASRDNRSLPARSDPTAEVAAGRGPAEPGSAAGPHTARARAVFRRRSARAVRSGGAVEHGGALARPNRNEIPGAEEKKFYSLRLTEKITIVTVCPKSTAKLSLRLQLSDHSGWATNGQALGFKRAPRNLSSIGSVQRKSGNFSTAVTTSCHPSAGRGSCPIWPRVEGSRVCCPIRRTMATPSAAARHLRHLHHTSIRMAEARWERPLIPAVAPECI